VGIIAGALTLAAAQTATAADLGARIWPPAEPVYKAAPAMRAMYSWTGFYAGGNVGYSWGKAKTDVTVPGFTIDAATTGGATVPVDIPGAAFSESLKPSGWIGGGQIGWNSQVGNWVLGLEADWQASGQKDDRSRSDAFAFTTTTTPPFDVDGTSATSLEAKLKWFGTVRGRLGYAWDSVMVYGTGGLAYGKFDVSSVNTISGTAACVVAAGVCDAPGTTTFSQTTALSSSKTKAGWTLGAGIEGAAFLPNWTWKAEYLYVDFGKFDHSVATTPGAPITTSGLITTSTRVTDHILRFGVNYRFAGGKGPVVASW
jgi:outer membrane immunogenic protein